jgi:hypothetical protein
MQSKRQRQDKPTQITNYRKWGTLNKCRNLLGRRQMETNETTKGTFIRNIDSRSTNICAHETTIDSENRTRMTGGTRPKQRDQGHIYIENNEPQLALRATALLLTLRATALQPSRAAARSTELLPVSTNSTASELRQTHKRSARVSHSERSCRGRGVF